MFMSGELWALLSEYKTREGLKDAQLARRTGVDHSQITRLRDGKTSSVNPDTLRKLAAGTGIPLVKLIIASGMWTAEELDVDVVQVDPHSLSNEDLIEVLARRLPPSLSRHLDPDGASAAQAAWVSSADYSADGGGSARETSREAPLVANAEESARETNGAH